MHELSLCESVVGIICQEAEKQGFSRVLKVRLEIGRLSCALPSAMRMAFVAVSRGTLAEEAELEILHTPGRALCHTCDREFAITERFDPCPTDTWRPLIDDVFGVFQGEARLRVALRFSPARAPWVREQVWHPDQRQTDRPDGSLDLAFPVADLREVTMKVLSFGADVTVLEPDDLRRRVADEVEKMWRSLVSDEKNPDGEHELGEVGE